MSMIRYFKQRSLANHCQLFFEFLYILSPFFLSAPTVNHFLISVSIFFAMSIAYNSAYLSRLYRIISLLYCLKTIFLQSSLILRSLNLRLTQNKFILRSWLLRLCISPLESIRMCKKNCPSWFFKTMIIGIILTWSWYNYFLFTLLFFSERIGSGKHWRFFWFLIVFLIFLYHLDQGIAFLRLLNLVFESYFCGSKELIFLFFIINVECMIRQIVATWSPKTIIVFWSHSFGVI